LVSIAALAIVEPNQLADSEAPLVTVVEQAGYPGWPLAALSLWLILNGALAQLVMASRVIYHSGQKGGAVGPLGRLNDRTRTPLLATVAVTAVAVSLALFFPLKTLAAATSTVILLVFAASNWALIRMERREPKAPFDTPVWLPWLALLLCLAVLAANFLLPGGGH
jgi:amino acid transporter